MVKKACSLLGSRQASCAYGYAQSEVTDVNELLATHKGSRVKKKAGVMEVNIEPWQGHCLELEGHTSLRKENARRRNLEPDRKR